YGQSLASVRRQLGGRHDRRIQRVPGDGPRRPQPDAARDRCLSRQSSVPAEARLPAARAPRLSPVVITGYWPPFSVLADDVVHYSIGGGKGLAWISRTRESWSQAEAASSAATWSRSCGASVARRSSCRGRVSSTCATPRRCGGFTKTRDPKSSS